MQQWRRLARGLAHLLGAAVEQAALAGQQVGRLLRRASEPLAVPVDRRAAVVEAAFQRRGLVGEPPGDRVEPVARPHRRGVEADRPRRQHIGHAVQFTRRRHAGVGQFAAPRPPRRTREGPP